jgi:hypothetical protein
MRFLRAFRRRSPAPEPTTPIVTRARPDRIERLALPRGVADATIEHFHRRGAEGHEGFILWPGIVNGRGLAVVTTAWIPAAQTHEGFARTHTEGMVAFVQAVHEEGWALLAQVHTHPGDAFHSPIDDRYPASGRDGFLSIVIPSFGRGFELDRPNWAVYELEGGRWRAWSAEEARARIRIMRSSQER